MAGKDSAKEKKSKKSTSKKSAKKANKKSGGKSDKGVAVLVGTRKGAFFLTSDAARKKWQTNGPHFLGNIIYHVVLDPRDSKTLLVAAKAGHLGPTIYRSTNFGKTWSEASRPPAFSKAKGDKAGRVVDHTFWLTPGHASEPDVWFAGVSPQSLFKSTDGGQTWDEVSGFNNHPDREKWTGGDQDQTPDGGKLHSVLIDPRDARHMYLGMSAGGCVETTDGGATWKPLKKGLERVFPVDDPDVGHDPHCIQIHPENPDRLYMQNHCGIYRIDRPSDTWVRIGRSMPKSIGDIGFPITLHPRDPEMAWVFPMDGSDVWPRTSIGGKPAVYRTENGGKSWQRQDDGLPSEQAWFTVKRQAMSSDNCDKVGVYFGTTSGEVWMSRDEGESWKSIASHLPHIYSVEAVRR
jgi:photosystem II stability/assembly factor-like uncharacterized protein